MRQILTAVIAVAILVSISASSAVSLGAMAGEHLLRDVDDWLVSALSSTALLPRMPATHVSPRIRTARAQQDGTQTATGPTIQTDKTDYVPGERVVVSGTGWKPFEPVELRFHERLDEPFHEDYVYFAGALADGTLYHNEYLIEEHDRGVGYLLTARGLESGLMAEVYFTDASVGQLDQCANGPANSPDLTPCHGLDPGGIGWVNGNLGASKSHYREGEAVPYRFAFADLATGNVIHTLEIEWDTTKSGKHALDYLTTFDTTVNANPCAGITGCLPSSRADFPIPVDPQVLGAGVTQIPGSFSIFGGQITAVSVYQYADGAGFVGDKSARITISFTTAVTNPVIAWGGHIATRLDWGSTSSAVSISGSPYHMRLIGVDGSVDGAGGPNGGNQDRSISAEAVIFPSSITVIKQASHEGSTSFTFSASPSPLSNFSLIDDGTTANTQVFGGIDVFQKYVIAESVPAGWTLDSITCAAPNVNGGSASVSSPSVQLDLQEGEDWTCTFVNTRQKANLIVIKQVVNDHGGTAVASDFNITVNGATAAGKGAPGQNYELDPGAYTVTESGPSGYAASYSADCTGTLAAGDTKTCTITNDDIAPTLTLVKTVVNDNGGTLQVSDFPLFINGVAATSGTAYPQTANIVLTASETTKAGYTASAWGGDCAANGTITLKPGDAKTCTITNNDVAPTLTLVKTVINNNGGNLTVSDFPLFINGVAATSGTAYPQTANAVLTASETTKAGYTASAWGGDCAANGTITLQPGDTKTCTITNDDVAPTLTLVKTVVNDNGGTLQVSDFPLFINGEAATSGTAYPQTANVVLTASETTKAGYTASAWGGDCAANGTITLKPGDAKTCTITNNDQAPVLRLRKIVVNDNGGTATAANFTLVANGTATNDLSGVSPVDSGAGLKADTWALSEVASVSGYQASAWACSGGTQNANNITLAVGQEATCTITNDDRPGTLIVRKVVVNNNGRSNTAADFSFQVNGGAAIAFEADGENQMTVNAGTYNVVETVTNGYTTSYAGCSNIVIPNGGSATCTITNDDLPFTLVTSSALCTFDTDGNTAGNQFRLLFTPDPRSPGYKLNATNPGQFYYNIFYAAAPGTAVTLTMTLPYPFVTQGANPVHAYDGAAVQVKDGQTCLTPGTGVKPITVNAVPVTLANYPTPYDFGQDTTVAVSFIMPSTGTAYVNIHLDYGLKGSFSYNKDSANNAILHDSNPAQILLPDMQQYSFLVSDGATTWDPVVMSRNEFKKNPGIGGLSIAVKKDADGEILLLEPLPGGLTVEVLQGSKRLGLTQTDPDGWYMWSYKYTGKPVTLTVKLKLPTGQWLSQSIQMKSNGFVAVDFEHQLPD